MLYVLQAFESNAAADFVADHCCSIYVNGGICTTQACKLCSERNKTIPEQKQEQGEEARGDEGGGQTSAPRQ